MKNLTLILVFLFTVSLTYQCTIPKKIVEPTVYENIVVKSMGTELTLNLKTGEAFNHPTYVIWKEDLLGNYLSTIFITQSYASGIFGHQMVGDSVWLKTGGESFQPAALPYWTHKKGMIDEKTLIPTPDHPFLDAYTGATPKTDLLFKTKVEGDMPYRILMEVNQAWDWNKFWTNNKYPNNPAYKHSAQPAIIYAVSVDKSGESYYLNPIGHADPKGESGKLYTNLNSLTSAKHIFETIKITLK